MDLTEVVLENTTHRGQLLAIVAELDYVPPALEKQDAKIAGLEHKLTQLEIKIASLAMQTKKEQAAEHEALHDSTTQRSATTVTGKYKVKANKEREYAEALEKEKYHKQQHATLSTTLEEARAVRAELASKLECYNKAQQDLALYRDIFDGPTTAYLGDDYLEYQVQQAQTRCDEIQDADSKVAADALAHAWGALDAFQWSVFDNVSGEHGNISPLRGDTAHEPLAEPDNTAREATPPSVPEAEPTYNTYAPAIRYIIAPPWVSEPSSNYAHPAPRPQHLERNRVAPPPGPHPVGPRAARPSGTSPLPNSYAPTPPLPSMGVGQYTMDPPPPRSRAASPSALGSHNVVPLSTPPADPTTQTTSQLSSTPPHAQPTGIPWPPLGLGNYAAPPGPPPAGWRAASPPTQAIDDTVPLGTDAPPTTHVTMEFLRTAPPTLPRLPSPPRGLGNYVSPPAGSRAASPSAWDHTDIVPSGTGTPLPTHATLQSGRTASPPTSSCAPPPRPPRPPLGLGNYGPPPAGSRAASPSAWDHTDIAPSGTGTPPMMHVTLQSVRTTPPTSSYAPPPRPPPPPLGLGIYGPPLSPPPAQSRTAFPTPWGGDNAVPLSPPPAYTKTQVTVQPQQHVPDSTLLTAPQPARYATPYEPPPPPGPELNYAPPLTPPPAETRAQSSWNAPAAPQPPVDPTTKPRVGNSISPRPTTNSTSPRPSANGTAARPFPPPRASSLTRRYAPSPQPQQRETSSYVL